MMTSLFLEMKSRERVILESLDEAKRTPTPKRNDDVIWLVTKES